MLRLIFLLIALYFVFKLFLSFKGLGQQKRSRLSGKDPSEKDQTPEMLVSCPVCGTFFQDAQGVMAGGKVVCGTKCAKEKT